jgi:hypothetical protein
MHLPERASKTSNSPRRGTAQRRHQRTKHKIAVAAFSLLAGAAVRNLRADDTWLGVDSTWDDPNNWSGGQEPSGSGTLAAATFATYASNLYQPSVSGTETFGTLSFSSGSWSIDGAGTLALTQINSTGSNTINPNLSLSSGGTFTESGGTLTLNGDICSSTAVALNGAAGSFALNGNNSNWTGGLSSIVTGATIIAGTATALEHLSVW